MACVISLFIGSFPGVWYVLPNRSLIHSWQVAGPLDASWLPLDLALNRRCADACDEVLGAPDSLCEVAISTAPAGDGYKPVRALVVIARLLPAFPLALNGASSPAASDPDLNYFRSANSGNSSAETPTLENRESREKVLPNFFMRPLIINISPPKPDSEEQ